MKKFITFLLFAVFSVLFVEAASPPDWHPPKYEKCTDVTSIPATDVVFTVSAQPEVPVIQSDAESRWCNETTNTTIETAAKINPYNRWRSTLIRKGVNKYQLYSNSKFLRSTIYNTKRFRPRLE